QRLEQVGADLASSRERSHARICDQVAGQRRGSVVSVTATSHSLIPVAVTGSTTMRRTRGDEMLVFVISIHLILALASGLSIRRPKRLNVTWVGAAGEAVTVVREAPSSHL